MPFIFIYLFKYCKSVDFALVKMMDENEWLSRGAWMLPAHFHTIIHNKITGRAHLPQNGKGAANTLVFL